MIVGWNAPDAVRACIEGLDSLAAGRVDLGVVVIVENGDRPAHELLGAYDRLDLRVLQATRNLGFAAGCNEGARAGSAPYVLFLNPDTVVAPSALEVAVAALESDRARRLGVVGARLVDATGSAVGSCAHAITAGRLLGQTLLLDRLAPWLVQPHFLGGDELAADRDVDQVSGAFCLMRRVDLERLGGWDERFFLYMEDADLAQRVRAAGLACRYVAGALVHHGGGGTTKAVPGPRLLYGWRSRILYARKHFGPGGRFLTVACVLVLDPAIRAVWALVRGARDELAAVGWAFRRAWRDFPYTTPATCGEVRDERR